MVGGLTGNLTHSLTSCLPPTDTLCCFQLFLETWRFWQPSKKVEMRFFSKQEKQNTFILFYFIYIAPNHSRLKYRRYNDTQKTQQSDDSEDARTIQIQTNTERRQSWLFLLLVDAPSSLSAAYLCSLLSSSLSGGVETVEAPGATEGTALWTSQVCPAGSAVQCIIEVFREGGNESRALVSGVGWAQELCSILTLLTDLRPPAEFE